MYTKRRTISTAEKYVSELIILSNFSSYSHRGVVWCAVAKEAEKMRNILEDLYYGNITPGA